MTYVIGIDDRIHVHPRADKRRYKPSGQTIDIKEKINLFIRVSITKLSIRYILNPK